MIAWPTLDELQRVAAWAARSWHHESLSAEDRMIAAYDAMTEHIATGGDPAGLPMVAWQAVRVAAQAEAYAHGAQRPGTSSKHGFSTWWRGHQRITYENGFVRIEERLALAAVWKALSAADRSALRGYANAGEDLELAAQLAGVDPGTYRMRLSRARKRARILWFYPEPPAPFWARSVHRRLSDSQAVLRKALWYRRHKRRTIA